jgi:uncharacterized protein YciI
MLFAIRCLDKPGAQELRLGNRAAHLIYLGEKGDRVKLAGPLLSDAGTEMIGSLLVVDFADRAEAEAFAAGDPYAAAGLFAEVSIHRFKHVLL